MTIETFYCYGCNKHLTALVGSKSSTGKKSCISCTNKIKRNKSVLGIKRTISKDKQSAKIAQENPTEYVKRLCINPID